MSMLSSLGSAKAPGLQTIMAKTHRKSWRRMVYIQPSIDGRAFVLESTCRNEMLRMWLWCLCILFEICVIAWTSDVTEVHRCCRVPTVSLRMWTHKSTWVCTDIRFPSEPGYFQQIREMFLVENSMHTNLLLCW